jgi:serine protease Do
VGKGLPDFTELYEQQGPAVVSIDVTQKSRRSVMPELSEDDPFYEFFRRFGQIPRNTPRPRDFEQQSTGSGFILSADGYILTNAHVVDEASEVSIKLTDKREFKAKVIGTDKRTDVALLKIEATGLPKVTIGDPEKLKVGEWVAAIGKPFGLENTITAGIVSAKGRELPNENLVSYIQTDVPINPGNSGGPLFNLKGEVVGVNSMIYSRTGGSMGLAFAIPIDVAINVTKQIQEKGRVTRSRIGVQIQEVSRETADAFGLAKASGALVNSIEKGGPADKAGIEQGDIIVKADGRTVSSSAELPRIITAVKPGTRIVLQVWRKGAIKDVNVTVAELKEDEGARPARRPPPGKDKEKAKPNRMGLVLSDLSEEQKKELEIRNGVGVEEISGTARGDIQPGDVILALISRGTTIEAKSAEQLNAQIAKAEKGSSVTFLLKRGERQFYSTIKLGNGGE